MQRKGLILTVRQPWAQAIMDGLKRIEYRSWTTRHRGPLLIHGAARIEREECDGYGYDPDLLVTGAIVGSVELADVKRSRDGSYRWLLKNPQPLKTPIPAKGKLGLWRLA